MIKRIISILLVLCLVPVLITGCGNISGEAEYEIIANNGEITFCPYKAYYNDDGTFTLVVAISNKTAFSKMLSCVNVDSVKDDKDREIISPSDFILDEELLLAANSLNYVQCDFEADQVLVNTDLSTLSLRAFGTLSGCVHDGAEPERADSGLTASLTDGKFTDTLGFDGSMMIRNNDKSSVSVGKITFDIVDDKGNKINTSPIEKNVDLTVGSGKTAKFAVALSPEDVDSALATSADFDMLYIKNLKAK